MSDGVLTILKFCLFALLYLFLARVVWTVVSEMRGAPAPVPAPVEARPAPAKAKPTPRRPWRLVVLEPEAANGRTFEVHGELTIGRAAGCGVSLPDDTYVSNVHARVNERNGEVLLEDLGSTNGTLVDGSTITAPRTLRKGDRIQIGQTVLEVAR
ncbi:MAG TPA: FHA domain-containing protein [Acidimicrobiia bacterium]|nr:FHA domain-containing protein [Acidimicrobiia bacterium]